MNVIGRLYLVNTFWDDCGTPGFLLWYTGASPQQHVRSVGKGEPGSVSYRRNA
jgi:hypothetical protein